MKKHVMYVLTIVSMAVFSAVVLRAETLRERPGKRVGEPVQIGPNRYAITCTSGDGKCWWYEGDVLGTMRSSEDKPAPNAPLTTDLLYATSLILVGDQR